MMSVYETETDDHLDFDSGRPLSTIVLIPPDCTPEPSAVTAKSFDDGPLPGARLLSPSVVPSASAASSQLVISGSGLLSAAAVTQQQLLCSPFSSTQSSLLPVCRICQCSSDTQDSPTHSAAQVLISACRCTGSLQYVHPKCLRRWIEVCQKRKCSDTSGGASSRWQQDACELCGYVFRKRTALKRKGWKFPSVSTHDKCLHGTFLACVAIMLASVVAMVLCFAGNRDHSGYGTRYYLPLDGSGQLSDDEVASLASGITFFASFFVAMVVEMKAKRTIYQIVRRCIRHNTVWIIENYSSKHDMLYCTRQGSTAGRGLQQL